MKKKFTIFILVVMIALLCAVLSGCNIGRDSVEDILEKNDLVSQITYFSNGGWFGASDGKYVSDVYYKENAKALEITSETPLKVNNSDEYVYMGWYTIQTAEYDGESYFVCDTTDEVASTYKIDGNAVVVKKSGKYVIKIADYQQLAKNASESESVPTLELDEPFDFKNTTLQSGTMLYLATKWVPNQKIEFILITEGCTSITVINKDKTTTVYNSGDVLANELFDSNGEYDVPNERGDYYVTPDQYISGSNGVSDATFVDYYLYEENATIDNLKLLSSQTDKLMRPAEGNLKVYVKYTAGKWKVVRFGADVKSVFASPTENYYIARDIDCQGETISRVTSTFSGTIKGNGHTISGINVKVASTNALTRDAGLFGTMSSSAVIEDVTFASVSISYAVKSNVNIGLIAHGISAGGMPTINNVKFVDTTMTITLASGANISNMPVSGGEYNTASSIICGMTNAQVAEQYPTLTLQNCKVVIQEKQYNY